MAQKKNKIKTYKDFPEFYKNDFVKSISKNPKWTVSDKNKRPIDMIALMNDDVWGASFARGYNPFVSLETMIKQLPDAVNNAYYLEAETDKFVVLDIEPCCPDVMKKALLRLPYVYGEISMSGKGYHLVFPLPEDIWAKYPAIHNKVALKEKHKNYEILINHMVTFTRNYIEPPYDPASMDEFIRVFETLAREAKQTQKASSSDIQIIDTKNIPLFDRTMTVLKAQKYKKKPDDFYNDMSRYEFGMAGFYYNALERLTKNQIYKNIHYTNDEKATIIYALLQKNLEHREKHDTKRNNVPWLLYISAQLVGRSELQKSEKNSGKEASESEKSNSEN